MSKTSTNTRLLYLDGLRALTALYVVLHHAAIHYSADFENVHGLKHAFISLFHYGRYAVDIFIVISGFSLMLPFSRQELKVESAWQFYRKRAIRILPPYFFAIVFSVVLIGLLVSKKTTTHWDVSIPYNAKDVFLHLLLVHDFFTTSVYKINHAFWSISVECRIYLLFPIIILLWRKLGALKVVCLALMLSAVLLTIMWLLRMHDADINIFSPGVSPYIVLFVLGMVAADASYSISASYRIKYAYAIVTLVLLIILFLFYKKQLPVLYTQINEISAHIADVMVGSICAVFLWICSVTKPAGGVHVFNRFLSLKPLAFIGSFSYSIYLLHAPLLQVISEFVLVKLRITLYNATLLLMILGCLLSIGVAYIFFVCCERPFLNWAKIRPRQKTMEAAR